MARATNSFPVPLSPVISTVASVGPTVSMASKTLPHGRALAHEVGRMRDLRDRFLQALVFLLALRWCARALLTRCAISSGSSGLVT